MNAEKIFGENAYVNLDEVIETVYQCRGDEANDEWVERWLKPLKSIPTIEGSIDCISREWLLKLLKTVVFKFDDGTVANGIDVTRLIYPPLYQMIKDAPSAVPQVPSEDCISRKWLFDKAECGFDKLAEDYDINHMLRDIKDAPSVMPKRSCYRCGLREDCEDSTARR